MSQGVTVTGNVKALVIAQDVFGTEKGFRMLLKKTVLEQGEVPSLQLTAQAAPAWLKRSVRRVRVSHRSRHQPAHV